jgi:hypothetical protein
MVVVVVKRDRGESYGRAGIASAPARRPVGDASHLGALHRAFEKQASLPPICREA